METWDKSALWACKRLTMADSPDIVTDSREREFRTISATAAVTVLGSHRTGGAVWAAQAVHADDEEARDIKGPAIAAQQWTPPVTDVGTPCKSMTYNHGVVSLWREHPLGGICHGDVEKDMARLQSEGWDDCNFLVRDQTCERVLRL